MWVLLMQHLEYGKRWNPKILYKKFTNAKFSQLPLIGQEIVD